MELAAPCPICKIFTSCQCRQVLVSFFTLLDCVQKRVLTTNSTSDTPHPPVIGVGVDKLEVKFQAPVEIQEVLENSRSLKLESKIIFLKSKKPYLSIFQEDYQLHLSLDFSRTYVTGYISNPNKFGNWTNYIHFVENILTPATIHSAKIQRLDLNMDFAVSFSDLIQKLDIKNKSTAISFDEKSGNRTGLNIGKKPELVVIYNKSEQTKAAVPYTRIEVRFSGAKLPFQSIYDLPEKLVTQKHFENVTGVEVQLIENRRSEDLNQKLQEFRYILKRDGYYSARKYMNKMRNFDRDFAKLIKVDEWTHQPSSLFKQAIVRFLKPPQDHIKLVH